MSGKNYNFKVVLLGEGCVGMYFASGVFRAYAPFKL